MTQIVWALCNPVSLINEKKVNNIHYNYMDILHTLGVFHESLPVNVIALW